MSSIGTGLLVLVGVTSASSIWYWYRRNRCMRYIREAKLPPGIYDKLRKNRPDITPEHFPLINLALRDFFAAYLLSGGKPVSMPSQAADELWHEFILYTRNYHLFCRKAFGRFLHHTPAAALSHNYERNDGLRLVWKHVCKLEDIDPRKPARLPRLFALDAKLGLADGYRYVLDCRGLRRTEGDGSAGGCGSQCATDLRDGSSEAATDGWSIEFGGDGGDGGGCGGGD